VKVFWQRYYSNQEARSNECDSKSNDKEVSDSNKSVYEETFKKNELSATPDETRCFKYSQHCGEKLNRVEVMCQVPNTTAELVFS